MNVLKEDSVTYSVVKDNKVIALAFLHNLSEFPNWAEVGIMINKDYHKKKIGTSVIKKLIETSSYDNFYAVINPNNIGSRKLFEKLGFIYDPNLKREGYISYIYRKSPQ
jgi:RimJ/RimL family protein N-acetyltransferase